MQEPIKLRDNFSDIDVKNVAYIAYELHEETPDFSTFTYGSHHSIVLRNKQTRELERINFVISGSNGEMFPESKRVWGDIEATDSATAHCCLCFYLAPNQKDVESISASFCAPSASPETSAELTKGFPVRYAAESTKYDFFYLSRLNEK